MPTNAIKQNPVDQYLDGLSAQLGSLPPNARREELVRIRLRIDENLRQLERARPPAAMTVAARDWPLDCKNAEWLGVCAGIASHLGLELAHVRLGVVMLGLMTGPFALFAYLAAYGFMSTRTPAALLPQANGWRAIGAVASTTVVAVLIFLMAQATCLVILHVHDYLMGSAAEPISYPWNWLPRSGGRLLFWTVLWLAPLAVLGTLPLAGGWSSTLRKTAHAAVALMGIAVAFGVACLLVGALMQVLPHTAGIAIMLGA